MSDQNKEPLYCMTYMLWRLDEPDDVEHRTLLNKPESIVKQSPEMAFLLESLNRRHAREEKEIAEAVANVGKPLLAGVTEEVLPGNDYPWPPGKAVEAA